MKKYRILSVLLALALLLSTFSMLSVNAANPTSLDIAKIAAISGDTANAFKSAIQKGSKDIDGVYYNVTFPALNYTEFDMGYEDYILMAASAIYALSEGEATSTKVNFKDVTFDSDAVKNGKGTSLNKAQYVELAERVSKYGNTLGTLPSSFNRPTDGTNVYEGRMTIYSIGHLFAEVLTAYNTSKALPATVTFLPVHFGNVEVTPAKPVEPENWYTAVIEAAVKVKESMAGGVLPGSMAVGPVTVTPAQFLYLACKVAVGLNNGSTSGSLTVPVAEEPGNPQNVVTGQSYKADYIDMAGRIATYIETNKQAPNCATSNELGGYVGYHELISAFARILAFWKSEAMLPNYVTISVWSGTVQDVTTPTTPAVTEPTTASTAKPTNPAPTTPGATNDWYANVVLASTYVVEYVAAKEDLPASIPVGTASCKYAQYLYLAAQVINGINNGQTTGTLSVPNVTEPSSPTSTLAAGTFQKSEYLDILTRIKNYMDNNGGQAPNYASTSLGQIQHEGAVYLAARVLDHYAKNGTLPASLAVKPWYEYLGIATGDASFGNDFSSYKQYMVPTSYCQSNNATIISVAKTGMAYSSGSHGGFKKPTTTYQAMFNLMEYISAKISYDYYYNTDKGALGTWNAKAGNCCDMAHLVTACARALGVPARYEHWNCQFAVTNTGHVWSSVYCPDAPGGTYKKPGWLPADPVNSPNYLGYQNHTNEYRLSGPHATLPF